MPRAASRKDYPLSVRLPDADIAMIDRAAGLRGRSRTDFVRDAAVRAAEDVIMETALIRMSPDGFEVEAATLIGGRALIVNAVDGEAAAFWVRRGFVPSKDDSFTLFRSIGDIAKSLENAL